MKNGLLLFLYFLMGFIKVNSQNIEMSFPKFAGKSYDFVIFQGSEQKTINQGVIPEDGKFMLSLPKEYEPYKGMSRWLITGTREGGGLDMYIPGQDFSISCAEAMPDEKNIIYTNNTGNNELNKLDKYQEEIVSRYEAMLMATRSYNVSSPHYPLFKSELEQQKKNYARFQNELRQKTDYISHFLLIVNITRTMGSTLTDSEVEKAKDIAGYISKDLDWGTLYTSGHWTSVIGFWVNIHSNVLKDSPEFVKEFKMISAKIPAGTRYMDFCEKVAYYLKEFKKEDYLGLIYAVKDTVN
ncbi:alkyl hydroperoxide reductase [Elizabethkingia anophelis]|uniref:alkyl hydroperoxide reductase n=1 Tax=Elizabethkingia anophelis TaxID=1117645 RepID=UPI00301D3385